MKAWLMLAIGLTAGGDCFKPAEAIKSQVIPIDSSENLSAQAWQDYKAAFIQSDGRLIDYQQNAISHSEGQGYALLLATHFNDQAVFNKVWQWTENNLLRKKDYLFAWSWGKTDHGDWRVLDKNNATDGDILIAYALLRAAELWQQPQFKNAALAITQSILDKLVIEINGYHFLLPGEVGFVDKKRVRLNPSYQIIAAFELFAEHSQGAQWQKIISDANQLINMSLQQPSGLPPDWVWLDKKSAIVLKRSDYYGYDAVRVYLYQLWEIRPASIRVPKLLLSQFERQSYIESRYRFNQKSKRAVNARPAAQLNPPTYTALSGIYQIYAEIAARVGDAELANQLSQKAVQKMIAEKREYYGRSLYLLSQIKPLKNPVSPS